MKKITLACVLLCVFFSACQDLNNKERSVFYISIHLQMDDALLTAKSNLVMPLRDDKTGKMYYLNRVALITSADIMKGEVIQGKDKLHCKLKLYIDPNVSGKLHEAVYYNKGVRACITIDGFIAGFTALEEADGNQLAIVTTEALWNKTEAQLIVDQIPANYEIKGIRAKRLW